MTMDEKTKQGAVTQLTSPRPDLLAFDINGHIIAEEVGDIYRQLEAAYDEHDKIDLLVRLTNLDGWDWGVMWTEATWIGKTHALQHIRRYAVVGGPAWVRNAVAIFDPLFKMQMREFELADEQAAWDWLAEREEPATA
jgi:hypothetical protein